MNKLCDIMGLWKGDKIMIEYKWRYFIVMNDNELVKGKLKGILLVCDDVYSAKSFDSVEKLLKWVEQNTSLNAEKRDFKIEAQYLPYLYGFVLKEKEN